MPGESFKSKKPYLYIVEGILRQKVSEGDSGAQRRDYELKDGTKGTKYEIIYKSWTGRIVDLRINESEYGENLEVEFKDAVFTTGTDSRYFKDFVQKLAKADINRVLTISPYDFESDGKKRQGITIYQDGQKLESYYWDKKVGKYVNGFPKPSGDTSKFKKDDWKIYYLTVKKFLIEELDDIRNEIIEPLEAPHPEKEPEIPTIQIEAEPEDTTDYEPKEEVNVEDLPF